jgi:hypothetical protein
LWEPAGCGSFLAHMSTPRLPTRAVSLAVSVAGSLVLAAGCATVKPSEREVLSRPEMNPAGEALEEQFQSHVESAREGGMGGHGAAGGGCGCG